MNDKATSKILTQLAIVTNDVKWIKRGMEGNGTLGLIEETKMNTEFRIESETKSKILNYAIGGGWLFAIIFIILQLMGKI